MREEQLQTLNKIADGVQQVTNPQSPVSPLSDPSQKLFKTPFVVSRTNRHRVSRGNAKKVRVFFFAGKGLHFFFFFFNQNSRFHQPRLIIALIIIQSLGSLVFKQQVCSDFSLNRLLEWLVRFAVGNGILWLLVCNLLETIRAVDETALTIWGCTSPPPRLCLSSRDADAERILQCHLSFEKESRAESFLKKTIPLIPPKRFDIFSPLTGGCSEGLGAF